VPKTTSLLSDFLTESRILVENARNLPEMSAVLQDFGYTAERLDQGLALLAETEALIQKQIREYGESYAATKALNDAWAVADAVYIKTLKVARIAFGDEPRAGAALKLSGLRKQTVTGWLDQASTFYANLSEGFAAGLSRFGYTAAKLAAEAALVERVRQTLHSQAKESGEAQQATLDRDAQVASLDTWISELRGIARVAFADQPQRLESLGIRVLNAPRQKKKASSPV